MRRQQHFFAGIAAAALATLVAACSLPDATAPTATRVAALEPSAVHIPFVPEPEEFEVCKTYPAGVSGPDVTFDWSVYHEDDGHTDFGSTTLANGQCQNIAIGGTLTHDHLVTVTERVPAGFVATHYELEYHLGVVTTYPVQLSNVTQGSMHGDRGWTAIFVNRGAAGCSHGYWKQEHHFDSWPVAYTPTTLFSAVFENAFPGLTLADVLALGGGGLNALGRETVGALLNAGSGFYWYGPVEVIGMFNAVYPGTKDSYTTLKDTFEARNVAGCWLN